MIRYIKILFFVGLLSLILPAHAQEYLSGLSTNALLAKRIKQYDQKQHLKQQDQSGPIFLTLPFFDDFNQKPGFPAVERWQDASAFVNNGFGYFPPNQGVATMDALDSAGMLYPSAGSVPFRADELVSLPIRLDSVFVPTARRLGPGDSLYISFYYQPQGYGNAPEGADSLALAFRVLTGDSIFSVTDSVWKPQTTWKTVWHAAGMSLSDFQKKWGKNFVQVMIPLRDSTCFYKGFQFRFYNYASIANDVNPSWKANGDEWNIDYVYLNSGRSAGDTTHRALAFSGERPVFLKHYTSMPYRQYRVDPTNSLRPEFHVYMANLDGVAHQEHYAYAVKQRNGDFYYDYDGGTCNLEPFYQVGFRGCNSTCSAAQACPPVNSLFSLDYNRDTTSYRIVHVISDSTVSPALVDSMVSVQKFYNYFSYDDGTPELGYSVAGAGSSVAYQFKVIVPDTLRSVQIYFNADASDEAKYFNLMVWRDNNGKPGEVIVEQDDQVVKTDDGIYKFHNYVLDTALVISGTFYVGYQQQNQNLNVGFDANHDARDKIFYTAEDQWYSSAFHGALLMRPVLGSSLILGLSDVKSKVVKPLQVFPNPGTGLITFAGLDFSKGQQAEVYVYNLYGARVYHQLTSQNKLDVRYLRPGFYVAKVKMGMRYFSAKFLIRK